MPLRSFAHFAFILVLTAALGGCSDEVGEPDAAVTEDAGVAQDAGGESDAAVEPDAGMEPDAGEGCADGETRACAITETCGGTQTCEGGTYGECVAPLERCNGEDDDCDGAVDEDFTGLGEACTAGVGACASEGVQVCSAEGDGLVCDATPGSPADEVCDGVDDDCDGRVDESPAGAGDACTRGVGACERAGVQMCTGGSLVCDATPGSPAAEVCDGVDDDCDGRVDESPAGAGDACTRGVGACERAGVQMCTGGGLVCDATPGSPAAEVCDGVDDDCDGRVDESPAGAGDACTRGVGACERAGVQMCTGGSLVCDATPGSPAAEVCDGVDNDCDGRVDESPAGAGDACTRGVGACERAGVQMCTGGSLVCDATPGSPTAEVCDGDDNDCDGRVDESGTPTFTATGYAAARSCIDVAVGHINGDGHPDIVCAMATDTGVDPDTRLAYFRSTGPGTFGAVQYTSPVAVSPFRVQSDIALADLDGDGRDDIVAVGETMKAQVYRNTGGAFAAPVDAFNFTTSGEHGTGGLLLYDFNGDGRLDILTTIGTVRDAAAWQLVVSRGNGNGTFQAPTVLGPTNNGRAMEILVGDVDADGDEDLLVLTNERVIVYRRAGSTVGAPEVLISGLDSAVELGYADVTGDGRPDLLIPQEGNVQLHRAQGLGFAAPVTATLPGTALAAAFMEFDCDATPEAVVSMANVGATPTLYANPATLADPINLPAPNTGGQTVAVADLDGDGFDDLIIGRTSNGISVLRRVP